MISNKLLGELDPLLVSFIWQSDKKLRPVFRSVFSCDGHLKEAAYIIVNPAAKIVFKDFKEAVEEHDIIVNDITLSGRVRQKIIIPYKNRNELLEKLELILQIGETLCQRTMSRKLKKKN